MFFLTRWLSVKRLLECVCVRAQVHWGYSFVWKVAPRWVVASGGTSKERQGFLISVFHNCVPLPPDWDPWLLLLLLLPYFEVSHNYTHTHTHPLYIRTKQPHTQACTHKHTKENSREQKNHPLKRRGGIRGDRWEKYEKDTARGRVEEKDRKGGRGGEICLS